MTAHQPRTWLLRATTMLAVLALAACGSAPKKATPNGAGAAAVPGVAAAPPASACPDGVSPYAPAQEDPSTRGDYVAGGLYKPGVPDRTPDYVPNVDCIPEPVVLDLPRSPVGNRSPYTVLGKQYKVLDRTRGYAEQGIASYYGSKFHGRRTSNLEVYDMYAFTAAHKTLPLPSFARVTNLDNGRSVVVRVNDRGPFHDGRVVDLSYAAAVKLGIVARGTGRVEVRALVPGEDDGVRFAGKSGPASTQATAAQPAPQPAQTAPAAPATAMDHLVQALPATSPAGPVAVTAVAARPAAAPAAAPSPAVVAAAGSSDTPRPAAAIAGTPAAATGAAAPVPGAAPGSETASAMARSRPTPAPASAAGALLQVASFSSADNARRALERLLAAGISDARLVDVVSDGRTLWRLRVPAAGDPAELAVRIAGLGFGIPQPVRD